MEATATLPLLLLLLLAAAMPAPSHGWGVDGHLMVCQIAQVRALIFSYLLLLPGLRIHSAAFF
jgi:hypothetical protein